jgi:hypothetical protein
LSGRGGVRSSLRKEKETEGASSNQLEQEILGDGQFDRFSLARRTRRFKRPTDLSSTNDDTANTTNATTSPDSISDSSFSLTPQIGMSVSQSVPVDLKASQASIESDGEKSERLKRWKDKSNMQREVSSKEKKEEANNDVVSRIGKIGRSISRISQEDVREAIKSLKSPTPEREWTSKELFRTNGEKTCSKLISHELNDEGFEETQSLVSDTPSHGKDSTSSCNEDKIKRAKPVRLTSTDSAATSASDASKRRPPKSASNLQSLLARNHQSLERSRSMRQPAPALRSLTTTPRRVNSLRRPNTESQTVPATPTNKRFLNVERSNSKSSLRSSRSSLNSAVSTNTVKKMPLKPSTAVTATSSLAKKPLVLQNSSTSTNRPLGSRVPASRSSSSGSSIGPVIRKPPPTSSSTSRLSSSISTSFKENQHSPSKTRTLTSSRSTSQVNSSTSPQKSATNTNQSRSSGGFMRPTTSSASKLKSK